MGTIIPVTYSGPEKRTCKRVDKRFIARFRERLSSSWDIVTLENLSAGGALFNHNQKLPPNSLFTMRIDFPTSEAPIGCIGKVLRVEKPSRSLTFHVAAAFTDISGPHKGMINTFANNFQKNLPK